MKEAGRMVIDTQGTFHRDEHKYTWEWDDCDGHTAH